MVFDRRQHLFHSPTYQRVVNEAASFFMTTPVLPLPPDEHFYGVGVYGLYYLGDHTRYTRLVQAMVRPIYIGKAVPPGWRAARSPRSETTTALYSRLAEHARSISYTSDLRPGDFRCRVVILDSPEDDLVSGLEAELIRKYAPVWNTVIDGFGNHDPGSGRYDQSPSQWDILHPGRPWAVRLRGRAPLLDEIIALIERYMNNLDDG